MRWFLCLLIILSVVAISVNDTSAQKGMILYKIHLDKLEYKPDDTITIRVEGPATGGTAFIVIAYAEFLVAQDPLEGMYQGIKEKYPDLILYEERKELVDGWAETTFTIPKDDHYSYWVYAEGDTAFFFARENASNISISDLTIYNPKVKPGDGLSFTAKVNDGLGNPISYAQVSAEILDSPASDANCFSYYLEYDKSTKLYNGWIIIPSDLSNPKTYHLAVCAVINVSREDIGIQDIIAKAQLSQFEILESGVIQPCTQWRSENCKPVNEVIISNVNIINAQIQPGDLVKFEAKVTDNNGVPINTNVYATIEYQACWGTSWLNSIGMYNESRQAFQGEITMPDDIAPGTYVMKLSTPDLPDVIITADQVNMKVSAPEETVPFFDQYSFSEATGGTFKLGEVKHISSRLVLNCQTPLTDHPITFELMAIDENGEQTLIESGEISSDTRGGFDIPFNMTDRSVSRYEILLKSEYNGNEASYALNYEMNNVENYVVRAEGKELVVNVLGYRSVPEEFNFDQQNKKITLKVDTSDPRKVIEIYFPHELLDGNLTATVNGRELVNGYITKSYTHGNVGVTADSDETIIEIMGTTAIPEFPISLIMLTSTIAGLVIAIRFGKK